MFSLDPRGGHNRYKFNKDFFKKWTPEMAYVLGFMYADGDIEDNRESSRTQYTTIASVDKGILEAIKRAMNSDHILNYRGARNVTYKNGKTYRSAGIYRLRIGSKEMYEDLLKLGLTPRKSLTIEFPQNIPNQYVGHFIRGYFDGDGCVTIMRGKGKMGQIILKGVALIFTSGSKIFLEGLSKKVHEFANFNIRNIYSGSGAYYLKYSTSESVEFFKLFYNHASDLFLERKFNVFSNYFQLRPTRKDKTITEMLK